MENFKGCTVLDIVTLLPSLYSGTACTDKLTGELCCYTEVLITLPLVPINTFLSGDIISKTLLQDELARS